MIAIGCRYLFIGFIIFLIAFFGSYGTLLGNKCMIYTYATILFAISLVEVFSAVYLYFGIYELPHDMRATLVNRRWSYSET